MVAFRSFLLGSSFLVLSLSVPGCGGGQPQLQSISISAASPALRSSSGASYVDFFATGTLSDGMKVSSLSVYWGFQPPWGTAPQPTGVSISSGGEAQCNGFKGTIQVEAIAPVNLGTPLSSITAETPVVIGTDRLSCP